MPLIQKIRKSYIKNCFLKITRFIKSIHFPLPTNATLKPSLPKGAWLAKIDLKDAYLHVPINEEFQLFLTFQWGTKFMFKALPFCLCLAPAVFQGIMNFPLRKLRERHLRHGLSRRLVGLGRFKGMVPVRYTHTGSRALFAGIYPEPGKVPDDSFSEDLLARSRLLVKSFRKDLLQSWPIKRFWAFWL